MAHKAPEANASPQRKQAGRLPGAAPLPPLPDDVLAEIQRMAEESSRKAMARVRPQIEQAVREALKAHADAQEKR